MLAMKTSQNRQRRSILGLCWLCAVLGMMLGMAEVFAQEKISIRTDLTPGGSHAALHLAVTKGWFKEAGLDVDVQDGRGSVDTIQLLAAGKVDVGWVALGPMAAAREAGLPLKSVAGIFRKTDLAVMVDETSNIRTPKDLARKRILVFTASTWVPFIDPFLKSANLSKSDVEMVYVSPATLFATYAAGKGDALMSLGPFTLPIVNPKRRSRAILAADYGVVYPSFGVVMREDAITARRDVVQKIVKIVSRAWEYTYDRHEDEAVDAIIAQRPGVNLDRGILLQQLRNYRDFLETPNTRGRPFGWQSDKDWEAAIKSMEGAGILKPGRKPEEFFTNEFIN
jgi:NitT/TauT family transport system substrate-binding protein